MAPPEDETHDARPVVELRYADVAAFERDVAENLSHGRAFSAGSEPLEERTACIVHVVHPASDAALQCAAEVVWLVAEGEGRGVGVMFADFDDTARERLLEFAAAPASDESPPETASASREKPAAKNIMERVRGYTTAELMRRARDAELSERNALERVYGKSVWEALLHNKRITPPEVARIARKGAIPKPLIDTIVAQAAWLASPEIRRALLANPRCAGGALDRVLGACTKKELELVAQQVVYTMNARQAAKRKLGRR